MKKGFSIIILLVNFAFLSGQSDPKKKVEYLLAEADEVYSGNVELSISYCKEAKEIASKNNLDLEVGKCNHCIAKGVLTLGNVDEAIELINQAIPVFEKLNAQKELAGSYSLKSIMVGRLDENDKAIEYLNKAYIIHKSINNPRGVVTCLVNLGVQYNHLKQYKKAVETFLEAEKITLEQDFETNLFYVNLNLGQSKIHLKEFDEAEKRLNKALFYAQKNKMKDSEVTCYNTIGKMYMLKGDKANAYLNFKKSEELAVDYNLPMEQSEALLEISEYYKSVGDYKNSMFHYEHFIALKDSMYRIEKINKITELEKQLEFKEKEQELTAKNLELSKSKLTIKHQQNITFLILGGLGIVLVILVFLFKVNNDRKKANLLLKQQKEDIQLINADLNQKNEEIEAQRDQIEFQKEILEQKNTDIQDSLKYAQKIQDAILPQTKILTNYFSDSFLLYKPKDIVSGDFYWLEEKNKKLYFSVLDCTGHGIPGAFVSLVAFNNLNKVMESEQELSPENILNALDEKIILSLNKLEERESNIDDGIDLAICSFDKETSTLEYSGANNSIYIISKNQYSDENIKHHPFDQAIINEVLPSSQMIGSVKNKKQFNTTKLKLQKGDWIVLFTDGYSDQFGGASSGRTKKLNYKTFRNLLVENLDKNGKNTQDQLMAYLQNWKGREDQTDDICIMGLRV